MCTSPRQRWLVAYFSITLDCPWPILEALLLNERCCLGEADRTALGQQMFDFALENVTRPHKGLTRYMHVHSDCATCRRDMGSQLFGIVLVQDNRHVRQIWTKPYGGAALQAAPTPYGGAALQAAPTPYGG